MHNTLSVPQKICKCQQSMHTHVFHPHAFVLLYTWSPAVLLLWWLCSLFITVIRTYSWVLSYLLLSLQLCILFISISQDETVILEFCSFWSMWLDLLFIFTLQRLPKRNRSGDNVQTLIGLGLKCCRRHQWSEWLQSQSFSTRGLCSTSLLSWAG